MFHGTAAQVQAVYFQGPLVRPDIPYSDPVSGNLFLLVPVFNTQPFPFMYSPKNISAHCIHRLSPPV